jgi:RimJ/RimL family protein N-acetyltransferase
MFVLTPTSQGQGVGIEAVESLVSEVRINFDIQSIGLNVYAENKRALRFWFHCGWNEIMAIDIEESNNREYTCVTLIRRFA